jgi:curli production assembly/transport component CsgF
MKQTLLTLSLFLFILTATQAQDLVYKPKNPAFGGNSFNYQWMLSSAQAQDTKKDPEAETRSTRTDRNSIDGFTESLNRQLLSRLSRQLLTDQFGEEGLEEGTFQIGDFQIDITQDLDGMIIRIFDGKGGETQITVPFP